jgi:hypothetical protein
MAKTLRICRVNDADRGVISASSEVSSLPVTNLQDSDIQKLWRATASPAWVNDDIGQVATLGFAALINSNATPGDSVRVRASTSDPTVTGVLSYDSGVQGVSIDPIYNKIVHYLPTPVSYRYIRIDVTQSGLPEAGRLVSGQAWAPSRHMSLVTPPETLWRDPSRRSYSLGQNIYVDAQKSQRGIRFVLRGLTDDEKQAEVDEINRAVGLRRDAFITTDVGSSNLGRDSYWGLLETTVQATRISDIQGYWEVIYELWERL